MHEPLNIVLQAYVQQLETSRLKLIQLEQELAQAKHQVKEIAAFFPIASYFFCCADQRK